MTKRGSIEKNRGGDFSIGPAPPSDHGSLAPVPRDSARVPSRVACRFLKMKCAAIWACPSAITSSGLSRRPRCRSDGASTPGRRPAQKTSDAMFADFVHLQRECLVRDSAVIDGVAETVAGPQKTRHQKSGSTTGYTREMMDQLTPGCGPRAAIARIA